MRDKKQVSANVEQDISVVTSCKKTEVQKESPKILDNTRTRCSNKHFQTNMNIH